MKKNPLASKESGSIPSKKRTTRTGAKTSVKAVGYTKKGVNKLRQNPGF